MPRNPTEAQIEASRRNGARSKGPVTEDGKQTVSQNARRLAVNPRRIADSLLLPGESSAALECLVQSFLDEYPPANEIELAYVNMAVAALWRLQRVYAVEQASLIAAAASNPKSTVIDTPDGCWQIPAAQVAESFKEVHGRKGHGSIFQISEGRYGRQYTHALRQLRELKQAVSSSIAKTTKTNPSGYPKKKLFLARKWKYPNIYSISDSKTNPRNPRTNPTLPSQERERPVSPHFPLTRENGTFPPHSALL